VEGEGGFILAILGAGPTPGILSKMLEAEQETGSAPVEVAEVG